MTKKAEPKKMGRPPEPVPQDKAQEICEWISLGNTLRQWCRDNRIHYSTVYLWMEKDKEFAQRFAHARDVGHDAIADECLEIIDTEPEMAESFSQSGSSRHRDSAHIGWLKNRAEMRLKLLAKWNPKKYGDKTLTEVTGADGGAIVIDDAERVAKMQAILAAAAARKSKDGAGV